MLRDPDGSSRNASQPRRMAVNAATVPNAAAQTTAGPRLGRVVSPSATTAGTSGSWAGSGQTLCKNGFRRLRLTLCTGGRVLSLLSGLGKRNADYDVTRSAAPQFSSIHGPLPDP